MSEKITILKALTPETNAFEAGGIKFVVHPSLAIGPYRHFQRLQLMVGYGGDYAHIYKGLEKAYTQLNTMKVADAAVTLNGLLEGVARKKTAIARPAPTALLPVHPARGREHRRVVRGRSRRGHCALGG